MPFEKKPTLSFANTRIAFAAKSNTALRKANVLFALMSKKTLVNLSATLAETALHWKLPVNPIIKYTIYEQFCGGENLRQTQKVVDLLAAHKVSTFLDYGVEAKINEKDFDNTVEKVIEAIAYAAQQNVIPAVSSKITGLARFDLLEKVHQNKVLNAKEKAAYQRVKQRLHRLCQTALQSNTAIYFDAEESWIQKTLDALITEMMQAYNVHKPVVYNTVQLYRHDRLAFLKEAHEEAKKMGYILGVKLVRGAYMEKERERAKKMGYKSPIQKSKMATDTDFNAALLYCTNNVDSIAFCNASHNAKSALYLAKLVNEKGIAKNHPHIFYAQLYGMSDNISFNLAEAGFNVAKYLPYGPVHEVVPYLIRRANENTAVGGQMGRELSLIKQEMKRRKMFGVL